MKVLASLLAFASIATATFQADGTAFKSPVTVAAGFRARVVFSNLTSPGGIAFDDGHNLLAVEIGVGVSAYSRNTASTVPGWDRTVVLKNPNVTQGIQVNGRRLFVSTGQDVLVYAYEPATKSVVNSVPPYPIIDGLPADGEFASHTILLETNATGGVTGMLVGSGPKENIDLAARDPTSGHSQIRRFMFPTIQPDTVFPPVPLHWADGQVVAYGLRNPAGFAFPTGPTVTPAGRKDLFVADNAASIEKLPGFTPQFANGNPADEFNHVIYEMNPISTSPVPISYGYPVCATLWNPSADPVGDPQYVGMHRGDQFSLQLTDAIDDSWCQNKTNLNQPPALSFQAHSSPADVKFFTAPAVSNMASFPSSLSNDAFVSFFGSFDRSPPTGYGVAHIPFPPSSPSETTLGYRFIVQAELLNTCPGSCITPDGLAFGVDGRLYVSSTLSGELFLVESSPVVPQ
ncbi:hypothetical protein BDZ94DRAFT_1253498 [Collybia nuda]|uniref:Pyrroloquinoline quinone-dependent pyranose dehydrogenase beta-propeller domain-containing protein n=1 Tax=Collybia nuda TaxID=64659 RepID=A0A9P5YBV3_9AGAR|nr:hypothetical protein BDZ94DRAFT_1253498 [Collybia nuda]